MELITLSKDPTNRFEPTGIVDYYSSLIWTERYSSPGDFELTTNEISYMLEKLPLESFVSLRESTVPMIVEAHIISKPKNDLPQLTIRGRSFDSVLERRTTIKSISESVQYPTWTMNQKRGSDAAYFVLREILGAPATAVIGPQSPAIANDAISEIVVVEPSDLQYVLQGDTVYETFEIEKGYLIDVVLNLLALNRHGLKAVRPLPADSKTTVDIEIYNGADLTELVALDVKFDQFNDTTYALGFQGSANVAYVLGPGGSTSRLKSNGPGIVPLPLGLNRRVLLVDEQNESALNNTTNRMSRGLVALYQANATALFDGEVADRVGSLFNKPVNEGGYGLGDIITLKGEYGLDQKARVVEFIRSSDSSGERAYPTFEAVDDL